jgi:cytochrome P450
MQTDPRYFSEPTLFVPERWDDTRRDPTWEHNLKAFIPFSLGQYGCPGKGLAYLEMRLFLVKVLRNFEFEMRGDFDHRGFWLGLRSYMGFARQPLPLKVHKRNRDPKS